MLNQHIDLVVFDMAGTTVRDLSEVEECFYKAAVESGLKTDKQRIKDMQGLPKLIVVQTLWEEAKGPGHPELPALVDHTYDTFCSILENHYLTEPVVPVDGAEATIAWLREQGVKVALTTGFYRKVTNIILQRLGWDKGLDSQYKASSAEALIDVSLTPDETGKGRPHPDMILAAMRTFGFTNPSRVVKAGDTPSDLQAGHLAGVGINIGITSGTHTEQALAPYPHHLLIHSVKELPDALMKIMQKQMV